MFFYPQNTVILSNIRYNVFPAFKLPKRFDQSGEGEV